MADNTTVHIAENSAEQVAYKLFERVAAVENKRLFHTNEVADVADRKWILDTYAECLLAVKSPSTRPR